MGWKPYVEDQQVHEASLKHSNESRCSDPAGIEWPVCVNRFDRFDFAVVTSALDGSPSGGRSLLTRLNRDAMDALFRRSLISIEIQPRRLSGWQAIRAAVTGNLDGLDCDVIDSIVSRLEIAGVKKVLIDGSNFGKLAAAIVHRLPTVEVTTFFHNCEARFFMGALRKNPSFRGLGVLMGNFVAERAAVLNSHKRVCLNLRDGAILQRLYGHGATHFSPMAMQDKVQYSSEPAVFAAPSPYALFVGGAFYANVQGIEWYVDNIAARAPFTTYVVGQGFERFRKHLERKGNVKVIGAVDDLAPWYGGANIVIAPIFDGAGMKTKVAEALMYGKNIIGTPEAFVGYEDVVASVGAICVTPEDFLVAMKRTQGEPAHIDLKLREIYLHRYSFDAAKHRLAEIMAA